MADGLRLIEVTSGKIRCFKTIKAPIKHLSPIKVSCYIVDRQNWIYALDLEKTLYGLIWLNIPVPHPLRFRLSIIIGFVSCLAPA